nr:unnamed protein product [Naegleria fowleri]
MKELNHQVDRSMKEFDHLDSKSCFEMMNKKIHSLEVVMKDFNQMIQEFKHESVKEFHNMKWSTNEQELIELKKRIEHFGKNDTSQWSPQQSPSFQTRPQSSSLVEWLFDPKVMQVSTEGTMMKIVKKTEPGTFQCVVRQLRMESGVFRWKVKIENLGWSIGVGASTQEIVSSKNFRAFTSHNSYFMTYNGFTWSVNSLENRKQNGFKFSTGDELELEMNCNLKELTNSAGESFTFTNIELPVYPSIALFSPNDSVICTI